MDVSELMCMFPRVATTFYQIIGQIFSALGIKLGVKVKWFRGFNLFSIIGED